MAASPCPTDATLRDYAAGRLAAAATEPIRLHLLACHVCRAAFQRLRDHQDSQPTQGYPSTNGEEPDAAATQDYDPLAEMRVEPPRANPHALGRMGTYELVRFVGRGAMGIVFQAFDTELQRMVALKVMAPQLAARPDAQRRFLREARAVANISHPNVVTIHAVDKSGGLPFLVMEFVAGQTLRQRIQRGPFDLATLLRIGAQVAGGLAAAHAHGVIHRDVKPANILLEDHVERVKLTDFGLAYVALEGATQSSAGHVVGTPAYMAPEQVRGERGDPRSDLFSLGAVLYAMVVGQSPFQGRHALEVSRLVTDFHPTPLHERDAGVPPFLSDVVERLLAKDPTRRFSSARDLEQVLLTHLADVQQRPSAEMHLPTSLARADLPKQTPAPPSRRAFGRRAILAVVVAGLLVAAGLTAWSLRPPPAPAPEYRPTLRELLERAAPGDHIRVPGPGPHAGPFAFAEPRLEGVVLESDEGAVLENAANGEPVVSVARTGGVVLRGVGIRARVGQHAVTVAGACPGLLLDRVRVTAPASSNFAAVYLRLGASGTAEKPLVLRDLVVEGGLLGIAVVGKDGPVSQVRIEGCRLTGEHALMTLEESVRHVTVVGNCFVGGRRGLSLALPARRADDVILANNTFFGVRYWLALNDTSPEQPGLRVERNLVLESEGVERMNQESKSIQPWFQGNWWEPSATTNVEQLGLFAERPGPVALASRDPAHPHFLRPTAVAMPALPPGDSRRAVAGALPPLSEANPANVPRVPEAP